jgi:hypothetical protein
MHATHICQPRAVLHSAANTFALQQQVAKQQQGLHLQHSQHWCMQPVHARHVVTKVCCSAASPTCVLWQ